MSDNTRLASDLRNGDKVYIDSGSGMNFIPGTVVKVTPAGFIDVAYDHNPLTVRRFDKTGLAGPAYAGESKYRRNKIDAITVEARNDLIAKDGRIRSAVQALARINVEGSVNYRWGADGLAREATRLQELLDAAKMAIAEIDAPKS